MIKSKLKRRLRKKFHLGEFQEFGFDVSINFKAEIDEVISDKFWVEFINEIEKNDLICGGGGNSKYCKFFVTSRRKFNSPKEIDRTKIKNWLENYFEIESFSVGELRDAWY